MWTQPQCKGVASTGSRAWSFHACPGSQTTRSPPDTRDSASLVVLASAFFERLDLSGTRHSRIMASQTVELLLAPNTGFVKHIPEQ